jgi:hypothetical protein
MPPPTSKKRNRGEKSRADICFSLQPSLFFPKEKELKEKKT